jgi:hypothetical protein
MPYVRCARCGLETFTVARWSGVDHCTGCDAVLPASRRIAGAHRDRRMAAPIGAPSTADELVDEQIVRERLYGLRGRREVVSW